jgi:hypothetical protein
MSKRNLIKVVACVFNNFVIYSFMLNATYDVIFPLLPFRLLCYFWTATFATSCKCFAAFSYATDLSHLKLHVSVDDFLK